MSFQLYLKIKPVKRAYKITKFEKCYSKNLRKNTDNLGFFLFPRLHHFKAEPCFEKLIRYSIKSFNGAVKKKLHFLVQSQVYSCMPNIETVAQMYYFYTKGALKYFAKFTGKHLCRDFFNFIKKESPAHVFSCKFCKVFKVSFFIE